MTKSLYLCGFSAFEYWTAVRTGNLEWPQPTRMTSIRNCAQSEEEVAYRATLPLFAHLSWPLDVLVTPSKTGRQTRNVHRVRSATALPERSFCQVDEGVFVVSPELCFLQLSRSLDLIDAILVGYEMCGGYALSLQDGGALEDCPPMVTQKRLSRYLASCDGVAGVKQARRAARYILDGARSPMEAKVAFQLTARNSLGGFGLVAPVLNRELTVSGGNGQSRAKQKRACDLLWEEQQVAVEYDSSDYHEQASDIDRDARRRNRLAVGGLTVLTATRRQVQDFLGLEMLAADISRLIGARQRSEVPNVRFRRQQLHRRLFANYGSPLMPLWQQRRAERSDR